MGVATGEDLARLNAIVRPVVDLNVQPKLDPLQLNEETITDEELAYMAVFLIRNRWRRAS